MLKFSNGKVTSTAIYQGVDLSQLSGSAIIALAKSKDSSYQEGIAEFIMNSRDVNLRAKFPQERTIYERGLSSTRAPGFSHNAFLNACNTDGINSRPTNGNSYSEENLAILENGSYARIWCMEK